MTVYVQEGCLFSDEALTWLREQRLPYVVKTIDSPDVLRELEDFETIVTPTFVIGDTVIYGFHPEQVRAAWNRRGGRQQ